MSRQLNRYLTVKEAAAYLGVSAETLRNWDRADKLKASRHPMNGYRLYRQEDLEAVLSLAEHPAGTGRIEPGSRVATGGEGTD